MNSNQVEQLAAPQEEIKVPPKVRKPRAVRDSTSSASAKPKAIKK